MVEYALRRRGADVSLHGDPDAVVQCVRTYRPGVREEHVLYVSSSASRARDLSKNGSRIVLAWNPESHAGGEISLALDSSGMIEATYDAIRCLDAWESQLKNALLQGVSLDQFVSIGRQMFSCPIAYFDCNLIVLAASEDYWTRSGFLGGDGGTAVDGQMPLKRAADLVEDSDYLHAAEKRDGFYYEDAHHFMYYSVNTFDEGEYLARLVFALPEGVRELHRGEEQLIDSYHAYLDDLHLRFAGHAGVVSSQNDSLHVLIRTSLTASVPSNRSEAAAVLASYGWKPDDDFLVAKLVFFEGVHWDSVSLYLSGLLEKMMAASCAFPLDRQIVWLVDLTSSARPEESKKQVAQRFAESLVETLRNYACQAGISDVFSDFLLAPSYCREADYALQFGQVRDPHYWYYWFSDYTFDYLLSKCIGDLSPFQVCHPSLLALREHDVQHGTEFARTLVCYLKNSQNTTHAASELFIHRTSFTRRMAQIEELVSIDLSDSDFVLHILLSAKLLGM